MIYKHSCEYCGKRFKHEKNLKKHVCEKMKRTKMLQTKKGKAAFMAYQEWMRLKRHLPPSKNTFMESRYYKAFIRFINFSRQVSLPDTVGYIKLMVSLTMEPSMWSSLDAYQKYLIKFNKLYSPIEQASMTVDTFIQLSKILDCDMGEVFKYLDGDDVMKMIQAKKLSPWILLFSTKFLLFLSKNTTSEQNILIQNMIKPKKWKQIFQNNPKTVKKMKKIVRELGI